VTLPVTQNSCATGVGDVGVVVDGTDAPHPTYAQHITTMQTREATPKVEARAESAGRSGPGHTQGRLQADSV
jgi:hypothetical protein